MLNKENELKKGEERQSVHELSYARILGCDTLLLPLKMASLSMGVVWFLQAMGHLELFYTKHMTGNINRIM